MEVLCLKHWRQAALLIKNNTVPGKLGCDPVRLATPTGTEFDLYEPEKPSVAGTILLVYGLTIAGEKDVRLVRFAQALTACGLRTVVPALPGLKTYRFAVSDLQHLCDLITSLKKEYAPLEIVAFSIGGSICLSVVSQPGMADCVEKLLLFSPPYDLLGLWNNLQTRLVSEPTNPNYWDTFIWRQAVLAYRQRYVLKLSPEIICRLVEFLWNYCEGFSLAEKCAFYRQMLQGLGIQTAELESGEIQAIHVLSPKGQIGNFGGSVFILHDPFDDWVPAESSLQIMAELQGRGLPGAQRLLITPLISNVSPRFTWRLGDVLHILDILGELFCT